MNRSLAVVLERCMLPPSIATNSETRTTPLRVQFGLPSDSGLAVILGRC
jgi:hypothetical protein